MTYHPATIAANRPHWLQADSTADATDWWLELTDPENKYGETCTAYFDHAEDSGLDDTHAHAPVILPTLMGVAVESDGVSYLDREWLLDVFRAEDVWRIEDAQFKQVNGV